MDAVELLWRLLLDAQMFRLRPSVAASDKELMKAKLSNTLTPTPHVNIYLVRS